ncbi:hypothetical protein JX266_013869 [Neoarthrinium moseri]|nr:hypothetical protein JX266_013869 [Neoarthrinium moseri]
MHFLQLGFSLLTLGPTAFAHPEKMSLEKAKHEAGLAGCATGKCAAVIEAPGRLWQRAGGQRTCVAQGKGAPERGTLHGDLILVAVITESVQAHLDSHAHTSASVTPTFRAPSAARVTKGQAAQGLDCLQGVVVDFAVSRRFPLKKWSPEVLWSFTLARMLGRFENPQPRTSSALTRICEQYLGLP